MSDKSDTCENRKFIEHLKKASKIVASWPPWKRNVLVFWNHADMYDHWNERGGK